MMSLQVLGQLTSASVGPQRDVATLSNGGANGAARSGLQVLIHLKMSPFNGGDFSVLGYQDAPRI
jgi:hypothetical protein